MKIHVHKIAKIIKLIYEYVCTNQYTLNERSYVVYESLRCSAQT
jgi:hypothetical protein